MTKARALGAIRKGLMSCFGPSCPLHEATRGPGVDHNQERLKDSVFTKGYECDPVLVDTKNISGYVLYTVCSGWGEKEIERKGGRDRDRQDREGGSGGVQGKSLPVVSLQESQIASGSRYSIHPCAVKRYRSSPPLLFSFLSPSFHSSSYLLSHTKLKLCNLFKISVLIRAFVAVSPGGCHGTG